MLQKHAGLAQAMGMSSANIYIGDIGDVRGDQRSVTMKCGGRFPPAGCWWTAWGSATWAALCCGTASTWREDGLIVVVCTISAG